MKVTRAVSIGLRAAALGVAVARLARAARPAPPVQPATTTQVPVSIAVVVPARNEVDRIGPLLTALREVDPQARVSVDLPNHRVVVESAAPRERLAAALTEAGYPPA